MILIFMEKKETAWRFLPKYKHTFPIKTVDGIFLAIDLGNIVFLCTGKIHRGILSQNQRSGDVGEVVKI